MTDRRLPDKRIVSINSMVVGNKLIFEYQDIDERVVFNLCGNKYRIVVLMDYVRHGMLIRFVGTHKEYDEIEDIEHI